MRKALTTHAFWVVAVFGLCYIFTFVEEPPDGSTREAPIEVGVAIADTSRTPPISYPIEDFTADTAYKVIWIADGDTVKIDYQGTQRSVRLIGVDTPETVHSSRPAEAYEKEASNFTKNLLQGESVYLRFGAERTDIYGRLLVYLYRAPDGLFVNLEIVRQGYGHVYTRFPFKHMALFQYYGNRARAAGKGLYGGSQPRNSEVEVSPAVESESVGEIYVTRTGKKYHRDGCKWLKRSKIPISLAEAKQRYGPCGWCKPPK